MESITTRESAYNDAIREVEQRLARGDDFDAIEDFIEGELFLLDEDQQAALWGLALCADPDQVKARRYTYGLSVPEHD